MTTKNKNAMPKLIAAGKLEDEISKFQKSGQRLQNKAHVLALSALEHLARSKDIRVTMKFINSMPQMARVNGLREWFAHFGPIAFDAKGAGTYTGPKDVSLAAAHIEPFWTFKAKEGGDYQPLDMAAVAKSMIAKLKKDQDKVEGRDHSSLIAALEAAAAIGKPAINGAGSKGATDPLTL